MIGELIREQIELAAQHQVRSTVERHETRLRERSASAQRRTNVGLGDIEQQGQHMEDACRRQLSKPLGRIGEQPLVVQHHNEFEDPAFHFGKTDELGKARDIVVEALGDSFSAALRLRLLMECSQPGPDCLCVEFFVFRVDPLPESERFGQRIIGESIRPNQIAVHAKWDKQAQHPQAHSRCNVQRAAGIAGTAVTEIHRVLLWR
ncbi:hypothetical protein [Paraburkholderia edwinii]|uniref:hypothetical protein n=1 Tax=Paraburkholderia edwinii TaxID=2861782 RepID=UPI001FE64701|nr:hypothetical protein [Paraburkholderia edwinii]